jgi:hypothetical protein
MTGCSWHILRDEMLYYYVIIKSVVGHSYAAYVQQDVGLM